MADLDAVKECIEKLTAGEIEADFRFLFLKDESALCKDIAKAIHTNTKCRSLLLASNDMGDASMKILLRGIEKNKGLRSVDISFNELTDDSIKPLLRAIERCPTLKSVVAHGNAFSAEAQKQLRDALKNKPDKARGGADDGDKDGSKTSRRRKTERRRTKRTTTTAASSSSVSSVVSDPSEVEELKAQVEQLQALNKRQQQTINDLHAQLAGGKDGSKFLSVNMHNVRVTEKLAATGGSFAGVYACYVDGWECAMKEFDLEGFGNDTALVENFVREIKIYQQLPPHNNIVRYLYSERDSKKIRLFLTRYSASLGSEIRHREGDVMAGLEKPFAAQDIARYCIDIVRGLEFLHSNNIIHRDLKSDNVFVLKNERQEIQTLALGDFDTAKKISEKVQAKTILGTPCFMAPEVLESNGQGYDFRADIFSFGMILYELMTLKLPYHDAPMFQIANKIIAGEPPSIPNNLPDDYVPLLKVFKKCISLKPSKRPSIPRLKELLLDLI